MWVITAALQTVKQSSLLPVHAVVCVTAFARRGASAGADGETEGDADDPEARAASAKAAAALLADDNAELTPAQAAKKARVSAMFEQLHQASTGSTNKLSKSNISLASLCSNTDPKKKRNTDLVSSYSLLCDVARLPHRVCSDEVS